MDGNNYHTIRIPQNKNFNWILTVEKLKVLF